MSDSVKKLEQHPGFGTFLGQEALKVSSPVEIIGIELSGEGAFSRVYRVTVRDEKGDISQVALKMARGHADIAEVTRSYKNYLLDGASKDLPGVVKSMGVFGVTEEGKFESLSSEQQSDIQQKIYELIFEIQEALPEQATQLLALLNTLGLETIQDGRSGEAQEKQLNSDKLAQIYLQITSILADIHKQPIRFNNDSERSIAYAKGLSHVIEDATRLDGVGKYAAEGSLLADRYQAIRSRMVQLTNLLAGLFPHRLSSIHADSWASNFFVDNDDKQTVYCIDPGTAPYGDPANDLVFALGDLVFLDVNNNVAENNIEFGGKNTDLAAHLVDNYQAMRELTGQQRWELDTTMPLFYAFKAFVSALFDAGKSEQQQDLLTSSAVGALDLAIESLEQGRYFDFSFKRLNEYAQHGQMILKFMGNQSSVASEQ